MKTTGYCIRVQGQISPQMAEWFEDLLIESQTSFESALLVPSNDQAYLFGVLLRIRDLGIRLIAVNPIEEEKN